ncbi:hypothetical protein DEIPH_ctg052orf0032 [Deinococcus phoenicis]|uniref:Crossover junction endodeoxyribonuclease RusA n=1 Tax=Deinococcus phoenicis TaxID=1476583 RepID=A0A016QM57_9DEIO|nr:hypothetical protein DEIPH_ctg052orf0032 [Deinococcus phoenicis]
MNGRNILSAAGRAYRKAGLEALEGQTHTLWPDSVRLSVVLTVCPPDRRRRDIDNYVKACLDLLTHGGVYGDDSQIDRLTITRGPVERGGRAVVQITPITSTLFEAQP